MDDNETYVEVLSASNDVWSPVSGGSAVFGRIRVKVHGTRLITPRCRLEVDCPICNYGAGPIRDDGSIPVGRCVARSTPSKRAVLVKRVFAVGGVETGELSDGEVGFIEVDDPLDLMRCGRKLYFVDN